MSLTRSGRLLAYAMRHDPSRFGLTLDREGCSLVEDILRALNLTDDELVKIVENDPKGRFAFTDDGRFYCKYGHSVHIERPYGSRMLTVDDAPAVAYHGTSTSNVDLILNDGILPMGRVYVHLSPTVDVARTVASRRSTDTTVFSVDMRSLVDSGVTVLLSGETFLSENVPVEFLTVLK